MRCSDLSVTALLMLAAFPRTALGSETSGGELVLIEGDIRALSGEPWMEAFIPVFRSQDYFLAIGDHCMMPEGMEAEVLARSPVEPSDFLLVHLRTAAGTGDLAILGEPVFMRGDIAVVRPGPGCDPFLMPACVFSARPLRPILDPRGHFDRVFEPQDGMIDDIVSAVSEDSIKAVIQHLEDYGTRLCILPQYDEAAQWVDDWFGLHWIPCVLQPFTFYGDSMSNVVAEIPGQENPERIYIVCGHLDSIVWPYNGSAPGADDNASGAAGVLEAARVLALYDFKYTIRFICFGAEEVGLVGSDIYAASAYAAGDDIQGVVNLDMVLYAPPGFDTLWVPYDSQSQALAEFVQDAVATYVPALDMVIEYDPSATYSDHASFWDYGYPAVLGIEFDVDNNPYYHQETDLLANYTGYWPFGTNSIRGAIAAIAALAEPIGPSGTGGGSQSGPGSISISPNPGRDSFSILVTSGMPGGSNIAVTDLAGRLVWSASAQCPGTPVEADLSGLPAGVYLVRWTQGTASGSSRLVKL
ncbi:M20/M25/M40 family metallo-hydrolase [Candidatus Fermentibacteria bacterium]|nr:M20/M25/M40 family metallo-hydrolase [Candidatus Fermentibacteria bacterium]